MSRTRVAHVLPLALLAVLLPSVSAMASDQQQSVGSAAALGAATDSSSKDSSDIATSNVELVASLGDKEQCLFRLGVYPTNTEQPAYRNPAGVFRAELIRAFADQMSGVTHTFDESQRLVSATVHVLPGSDLARSNTAELVGSMSADFAAAVDELTSQGVDLSISADAAVPIVSSCEIQESILSGSAQEEMGLSRESGIFFNIEEETGRLLVSVSDASLPAAARWAESKGDAISVVSSGAEVVGQGRTTNYPAIYGGSRIVLAGPQAGCTSAFRLGSGLLTADHCRHNLTTPVPQFAPAGGANGGYAGTLYLANGLAPAGVDVNWMHGGAAYSNRIWLGSVAGTTTRAVIGFQTEPGVGIGGYYRFSGSYSGEHTVIVNAKYVSGCYLTQLIAGTTYVCSSHMYRFITSSTGAFLPGDSGAPYYVWSSGSGPVLALGVHVAGTENPVSGVETGYGVGMEVISYLYGGVSIG